MVHKVIKAVVKWAVIAAIFWFFGYYLYKSWSKLPEYSWHFNYGYLALSAFFILLMFFLTAYLYHIIIRQSGARLDFKKVAIVRLLCEIGKYVPGKVWVVLGRFYFFKRYGISKAQVLVSIAVEMLAMTLAGFFAFALTLPFWRDISGLHSLFAFLAVIPLLLAAIHPKVINFGLMLIEKIFKKNVMRIGIGYVGMAKNILLYMGYWLAYGLGVALFIHSAYPLGTMGIVQVIGIHAISWVIGYVTLFAPGGIGVREGIMAYMLSLIMPAPLAIIFAIGTRLWITAIEAVVILFSFMVSRSALRR